MINVSVTRSRRGDVCALRVRNHGDPVVCAAVSALVINSVNSVEALTDERFTCEYVEEGGFLEIAFPDAQLGLGHDARLLLSSLMLGLNAVSAEYPDSIIIEDKEATI